MILSRSSSSCQLAISKKYIRFRIITLYCVCVFVCAFYFKKEGAKKDDENILPFLEKGKKYMYEAN